MLTGQRKKLILELLRREGQVQVLALSRQWQVSVDTIRRDLRELGREGLVQRVHGGALPASQAIVDYAGREGLSPDAKSRIGRVAAGLIHAGQVVALDGGTSTREVVRHLPRELSITVVTHSPTIAAELRSHEQVEVILIGGRLYRHSMVAVGAATVASISAIRSDVFFLGATGIHSTTGVTTGDWEEAEVKRAFCRHAAETVLLATPEKINAASPYQIIPAADLDILVVDEVVPEEALHAYREMGITIIRA